jgi:hypothetical protein
MIYIVAEDTDKDIVLIREVCIDSVAAIAEIPVSISLSGLTNGVYWLYARDSIFHISEPGVFTITGVGLNITEANQIRLYPNPANTFITIETYASDLLNIEITSLNGQLYVKRDIRGPIHQIDLSSFEIGVYFITIRSKDFVTTRKIIKL